MALCNPVDRFEKRMHGQWKPKAENATWTMFQFTIQLVLVGKLHVPRSGKHMPLSWKMSILSSWCRALPMPFKVAQTL